MSLVISKVFTYDTDAGNYIQAVEGPAGDNQALEPAVRQAINNFVIGCKQDGIWNAIKASCILAGARTLNGALVPLAGTAPTNPGNVFVQADYNRKTGLVGNGSTKYLDSNRNNNADPQNSKHLSAYASVAPNNTLFPAYIGLNASMSGTSLLGIGTATGEAYYLVNASAGGVIPLSSPVGVGFVGASRSSGASQEGRMYSRNYISATSSALPANGNILVYTEAASGRPSNFSNARLAFYSIGESLDLALLDARVTALINAFGAAIP